MKDTPVERKIEEMENQADASTLNCANFEIPSEFEDMSIIHNKLMTRGLKVAISQQVNQFNQTSTDINAEQQEWLLFSKKLSDEYGALKTEI